MADKITVNPGALDAWVKELEKFYPNDGQIAVIEWRRAEVREILTKIYAIGVRDGELFVNAKRNTKI